jgi:SSS family solute:Na+ symporter
MGAVFVFLIVLQLTLGAAGMNREKPYVQKDAKLVDLTPWKPAPYVGGAMILFVIAVYIYFAI